jgi:hypothetical protein
VSVALVTPHAKRMRRTILSSVACLALPYFSTLPHKRHDFRKKKKKKKKKKKEGKKKVVAHEMCFDFLYNFV